MASLSATVRRTHLLDIHTHRICREALHLRSHVLVQLALKVESERPVSNCGRSGCGLAARTGSERLSGWMEVTHRVQAERLGGYPQTSFVAHRCSSDVTYRGLAARGAAPPPRQHAHVRHPTARPIDRRCAGTLASELSLLEMPGDAHSTWRESCHRHGAMLANIHTPPAPQPTMQMWLGIRQKLKGRDVRRVR